MPWPLVTVAKARSPEDAVPFDFDNDGLLDVISCHEGKTRQVIVHRASGGDKHTILAPSRWDSRPISQVDGQLWMFAEPILLRRSTRGIIIGSKGSAASITLLLAPKRDEHVVNKWSVHRLRDAGWIMTLKALDMDGDGDQDLLFSDRKGKRRGVGWLEQPNDSPTADWVEHLIGGTDHEVMFVDATPKQVLVATRNSVCLDFRRTDDSDWELKSFPNPEHVPMGKAIKRMPDGRIVLTANSAADSKKAPQRGGIWLRNHDQVWMPIDETTEIKPDRIELIDLDGDGDLDLMTCEERKNLGVIWYENPER